MLTLNFLNANPPTASHYILKVVEVIVCKNIFLYALALRHLALVLNNANIMNKTMLCNMATFWSTSKRIKVGLLSVGRLKKYVFTACVNSGGNLLLKLL
jgi:hypothetical protein